VGEATHAGDLGIDAEVAAALGAEEVAGDEGGASAAQAVADDGVGEGEAQLAGERAVIGVAEERWGVVHQAVESAQAGEGCVQRGLVAGGQRPERRGAALSEVALEGGDLVARAGAGLQFEDCDGVSRVFREVGAVGVGDEVVGEAVAMEPGGEREQAALGAAELNDLREEEGPGVSQ
jgi:hypothetical protein